MYMCAGHGRRSPLAPLIFISLDMFCIWDRICENLPIMFDTSISLRPAPLAMRRRLLGLAASSSGCSRSFGVMLLIMDSHTLVCFSASAIC